MTTGFGIPKTFPEPILLNALSIMPIGAPLVTVKASPRNTAMVPSVAMIGSIRPFVMSKPLNNPAAAPAIRPSTMPTKILLLSRMDNAIRIETRPTTDPAERSNPPIMITTVSAARPGPTS